MVEALAYFGWRVHFADADQVDVRLRTGLFRFGKECRLAFLTMATRETIGRQPPDGRFSAHIYSATVFRAG